MRLSEAHADISVHLMTLNPGPGHGGMSCTSPSKSTFSMAWHHNRNAKNAQSPAKAIVDGSHGPDLGGKEDIDKISSTAPARPRPCGGPRWRAAGIRSPPRKHRRFPNVRVRWGGFLRGMAALRRLPGVQAATAGLSAPMLDGPPNWAERQSALTHRPNSGTRPTRQETAFQPQSGVAGPPLAWSCCGGSP